MAGTTLRDIALRASVSTATVSRVLNDYPHVDEKIRVLVQQIARELGYTGASLRRNPGPRSVLLLMRDEAELSEHHSSAGVRDFERAVAAGVQQVFEQQAVATRLQRTRMQIAEIAEYSDDATLSGIILLGGMVDRDFVAGLHEAGVPFVIAGAHALPLRVNCVMADVARATEEVIAHLVNSGRKRIGLVNGPEATATSTERMRGFRLALAEHDLAFQPDQVVRAEFRAEAGYSATSQLLAQRPDLAAILYPDDLVAMGGLRAIKAGGRRVPDDVAVVGFYDYDLAQYTEPPLTSLHIDMQRIGMIAARRLQLMIEAPDGHDWLTLVEASLVIRDSA